MTNSFVKGLTAIAVDQTYYAKPKIYEVTIVSVGPKYITAETPNRAWRFKFDKDTLHGTEQGSIRLYANMQEYLEEKQKMEVLHKIRERTDNRNGLMGIPLSDLIVAAKLLGIEVNERKEELDENKHF